MTKLPCCLLMMSLILISCAPDHLVSGVYEWNNLKASGNHGITKRKILEGETRSLEMFEINAYTLIGGYSLKEYTLKEGVDELLIVKEGSAVVTVNGRSERLDEGSIIVASQGDVINILNGAKNDMTFYSFRFKPWQNEELLKNMKETEPLFLDWLDIDFRENANGGRRDIMRQPTTLLKELEMHTTLLKEGLPSHSSHVHPDEEIILVRFGMVEESINGKPFQCGPGSVIFLTDDDDHGIKNVGQGPCEYYAIRWLTW